MPKSDERITARHVPELLAALEDDDAERQEEVLRLLCPCRNRLYDREVWLAIFRAADQGGVTGRVRDQAGHAIGTLLQRARADPRSQDLLRWLDEQEITERALAAAIPVWEPRGKRCQVNGIPIPRPPRSRRSRANRRH